MRPRAQGTPPSPQNTHVTHAEFDSNDDGRLELSELRRLCDLVGRALSDDELKEAIKLLGSRDSQHVYFNDFAGAPATAFYQPGLGGVVSWFVRPQLCFEAAGAEMFCAAAASLAARSAV